MFTYCVRLAINVKIIVDICDKSFLIALRRFLAKRGQSKLVLWDSFKTFKFERVKNILRNSNIEWKFDGTFTMMKALLTF